nr:MAG TPA: hypothetical protein [Caudoviricetes sp.]
MYHRFIPTNPIFHLFTFLLVHSRQNRVDFLLK